MRIPAFVVEHPIESLIAGLLLLVLLFGSSDRHAADVTAPAYAPAQISDAGKL